MAKKTYIVTEEKLHPKFKYVISKKTYKFTNKLNASRLASDVLETPIILIARTDSLNAKLITSDFDDVDKPYLSGKRTQDGYFELKNNKAISIEQQKLRYLQKLQFYSVALSESEERAYYLNENP